MDRTLAVIFLCIVGILPVKAQQYRASKLYVGVKGSLNTSFLHYSELHDQQQKVCLSTDACLLVEWRVIDKISIGLDFSYVNRKAQLEFNAPYLINYSTMAVTHIAYTQTIDGLECGIPFTWYFGSPKTWFDSYCRGYAFAGPSFFLVLDGSIEWKRTHLIDNQVVNSYQIPISTSSSQPFDYGVKVGFGMAYTQKVRHYFFVIKGDISFYYGLSDTFSDAEKKLSVAHFYGLGDVQHEALGSRYFRQVKFSVTFAIPLRDKPDGACRVFGVY